MNNNLNIKEQVSLILSIANQLRGPFKEDEYQNVIIPMTILRRFECILKDTRDVVIAEYEKGERNPKVLKKYSGLCIYNTSSLNLEALLDAPGNIRDNFEDYLNAFSDVAKNIFIQMKFYDTIKQLEKGKKLYVVIKKFAQTDLSVENVSSMQMGYIMEEIIRTYSANASAGDHFTPREVIRCLTQLLLAEGCDDLYGEGKIVTIADFACGTGGMLSESYKMIKELNSDTQINLFGQDNNAWYEGIAQAEMIIRGQDPDNIKLVSNTLAEDPFSEQKMRLIIMNPPFGLSYSKDKIGEEQYSFIIQQNKKDGWYEGGLPGVSDSQMLFWQYALNKLNPENGRAAIICNASPLFGGNTTSGESKIRKWIFDNDWVEAIIQFCPELFYNTGITIYAILFNKHKSSRRKGKIQLINASGIFTRLNKGMGFKRNCISENEDNNQISQIVKLYSEFDKADSKLSKIFDKEDFYYREVTVDQPYQRNFSISNERISNLTTNSAFSNLYNDVKYSEIDNLQRKTKAQLDMLSSMLEGKRLQEEILSILRKNVTEKIWKNRDEFIEYLNSILPEECGKALIKGIANSLSEFDTSADIYKNSKGKIEPDSDLRDRELIPYKIDINDYFEKEVKPFVPNSWLVYEKNDSWKQDEDLNIKVGCEINFNKYFYKYVPPKSSDDILITIKNLSRIEKELEDELND